MDVTAGDHGGFVLGGVARISHCCYNRSCCYTSQIKLTPLKTQITYINIETMYVPATLGINSTYCDNGGQSLAINLIALCQGPGPINSYKEESCGNSTDAVRFHYPFGMKDQDYMNPWFRVTCKQTTNNGLVPLININGINLQLLEFSFRDGTVLVNHAVIYSNCRRKYNQGMSLNLTGSPFYFSDSNTEFWAAGCGNVVTVFDGGRNDLISGCTQPSCRKDNATSVIAACPIMMPWGLSSFFVNMSDMVGSSDYSKKRSCGYTFLLGKPYHLDLDLKDFNKVPISLQWSTPISGLCHLKPGRNSSCRSDGSYCWQYLSTTHLCVCGDASYVGDIYSTVCTEENCVKYKYCHMLCLNTPGNYCSPQSCPSGFKYNHTGLRCEPKINSPGNSWNWKIIVIAVMSSYFNMQIYLLTWYNYVSHPRIGCSASIGTAFLLLGAWLMYKMLITRQNMIQKQKYFKRNGCLLLQQYLSSNEGNVDKIRLFAAKEMEMATDYYNRNRILGEGGQGTVYKGMLTDGSIVAIKKSKMMKGKAKVSDFGTSRSVTLEQTHLTTRVQGTFGYMDPEYFRSSQFTEKSDVYSFGVVLVELLTGQKPVSAEKSEEVRSLISYFLVGMQEKSLFSILDSLVVNNGAEKEIVAMAKLAKRCLNLNGKRRPTMKEVAMELELIKTWKQANVMEMKGSDDEESEIDDMIDSWDVHPSSSTTTDTNASF
ncbi:hypothetical protein GQ457_01G029460 [Hibiscus cannabinus]